MRFVEPRCDRAYGYASRTWLKPSKRAWGDNGRGVFDRATAFDRREARPLSSVDFERIADLPIDTPTGESVRSGCSPTCAGDGREHDPARERAGRIVVSCKWRAGLGASWRISRRPWTAVAAPDTASNRGSVRSQRARASVADSAAPPTSCS